MAEQEEQTKQQEVVDKQPEVKEKKEDVKENVKEESKESQESDEDQIDEKELAEIEKMISEADTQKLSSIKDELLSEIKSRDELIGELKEEINNLHELLEKKIEEKINQIQPVKKGVEVQEKTVNVSENREPTDEELERAFWEMIKRK